VPANRSWRKSLARAVTQLLTGGKLFAAKTREDVVNLRHEFPMMPVF
jgi:hypothetical protein